MMRDSFLKTAWRANRSFPLLLLGLLLLNLMLYCLVQFWGEPEVLRLDRVHVSEQTRLQSQKQQSAEGKQTASELERLIRDMRAFKERIPQRARFSDLLQELFTLSSESGLEISQVKFDPKELPELDLLRYSLSYSVSGSYEQLKLFINALESSDRFMPIDTLSLRAAGRNGIVLNLSMTTYFGREGT